MRRAVFGTLIAVMVVPAAQAEQPSAHEAQVAGYSAFLIELQQALRAEDRGKILSLVRVPLRVNQSDGKSVQWYASVREVDANFEIIFDRPTIDAILGQSPKSIFSRDIGAIAGNGEVWFDNTCLDAECTALGPVSIYAINHM